MVERSDSSNEALRTKHQERFLLSPFAFRPILLPMSYRLWPAFSIHNSRLTTHWRSHTPLPLPHPRTEPWNPTRPLYTVGCGPRTMSGQPTPLIAPMHPWQPTPFFAFF